MTAAGAGRASPNAHLLIGEMPAPSQFAARWRSGTGASMAVHAFALAVAGYGVAHGPQALRTVGEPMHVPVLVGSPGPAGKGGSGGAGASDPARQARIPEARSRDFTAIARPADPAPQPDITIPAMTAQPIEMLPGSLTSVDALSLGKGTTQGGGVGRDQGIGSRDGPGVGDGDAPGAHVGTVFDQGPGVTAPVLIAEVKPSYTIAAMRAKLQGAVLLEAVVLADGTIDPRSIRIVRSLDRVSGLDAEAVRAVKQWRFRPGSHQGRAAAVRVVVELTFTLR
jgi:periplasmic protein TonB